MDQDKKMSLAEVAENSSLLASSNADNGAHFNPLKQSQILTKGDKKPPNFAQTMPSENVFKMPR